MKKLKVLEVLYGLGYGGIRACIQNYISKMDREGFQIDIFAYGVSESPFKDQFEAMGCRVVLDPRNYIAEHEIILFVNVLKKVIRDGRYDVVHAHCNLISAWVTLAAKMAGAKVRITHSHGTSHLSGRFMQDCWCYLRRWIIKKTATHRLSCGQLAGIAMYGSKTSFIVLPNAIDVEKFAKREEARIEALRMEFRIPQGAKVYMNMTRLDINKNHSFLLDVIREIRKLDPNARYIIGGNYADIGSSLEIVKKKISEYELQDVVTLSGPRNDIVDLYHFSDCWIFPSIKEGMPFGPIEMQAAGIPCLVSDSVTKEIDLGLGLIEFMSLKQSPREWAVKACSMYPAKIDKNIIKQAFIKAGFDISSNVDTLQRIYRGEKL